VAASDAAALFECPAGVLSVRFVYCDSGHSRPREKELSAACSHSGACQRERSQEKASIFYPCAELSNFRGP
jgi:hypothetical protein